MARNADEGVGDLSRWDLAAVVEEAQRSGCECETCVMLRGLVVAERSQLRRWTLFSRVVVFGIVMAVLAFVVSLIDLLNGY